MTDALANLEAEVAVEPNSSVLDAIKARRKELAGSKTLTLQVPGYGGHLLIKYKAVSEKELRPITQKVEKSLNSNKESSYLDLAADLLIKACDDVLVRETVDAEPEPINQQGATTFSTGTLNDYLGLEAKTAREEVFQLFSPDGSQPLAATQHAQAITSWLQGNLEEIDKQLLGE